LWPSAVKNHHDDRWVIVDYQVVVTGKTLPSTVKEATGLAGAWQVYDDFVVDDLHGVC
jgi:hypothetical protein